MDMLQKRRKILFFLGEIKSPGYYTSPGLSVRLVLQQVQKPKSLSNLRKPLRLQQAIFVFCLLLAISVSSKTSTTFDSRSPPSFVLSSGSGGIRTLVTIATTYASSTLIFCKYTKKI